MSVSGKNRNSVAPKNDQLQNQLILVLVACWSWYLASEIWHFPLDLRKTYRKFMNYAVCSVIYYKLNETREMRWEWAWAQQSMRWGGETKREMCLLFGCGFCHFFIIISLSFHVPSAVCPLLSLFVMDDRWTIGIIITIQLRATSQYYELLNDIIHEVHTNHTSSKVQL